MVWVGEMAMLLADQRALLSAQRLRVMRYQHQVRNFRHTLRAAFVRSCAERGRRTRDAHDVARHTDPRNTRLHDCDAGALACLSVHRLVGLAWGSSRPGTHGAWRALTDQRDPVYRSGVAGVKQGLVKRFPYCLRLQRFRIGRVVGLDQRCPGGADARGRLPHRSHCFHDR